MYLKSNLLFVLITAIFFSYGTVSAQDIVYDFANQPVLLKKYEEYKGTPFWYDEWKQGTVKLKDGRTFNNLKLKYDIVGDQVVFDKAGTILKFDDPVAEFTLGSEKFSSGYTSAENRTERSFYQVIAGEKVQFLKRINKAITENKPYGSAVLVKEFVSTEGYYISSGKQMKKVKKDKKAIIDAIGDKAAELERFATSNKLNFKIDADIASLVDYYNTL